MATKARLYLEQDLPSLIVPTRLDVFGTIEIPANGRRKARKIACGWQGWNPDPVEERKHARLKGSGSFYWAGALQAYIAARRMIRADARITQVKIETISGREIGRIYV